MVLSRTPVVGTGDRHLAGARSSERGGRMHFTPVHISTVPARPARILVLEGDHPGGTERARRSPAPASQHASTHNDAPRARAAGSQHTPNRSGSLAKYPDRLHGRCGLERMSAGATV